MPDRLGPIILPVELQSRLFGGHLTKVHYHPESKSTTADFQLGSFAGRLTLYDQSQLLAELNLRLSATKYFVILRRVFDELRLYNGSDPRLRGPHPQLRFDREELPNDVQDVTVSFKDPGDSDKYNTARVGITTTTRNSKGDPINLTFGVFKRY